MGPIADQQRPILRRRDWIGRGQWVTTRAIEPRDASALTDFYARLSPESRRRRFLTGTCPQRGVVAGLANDPGFVVVLGEMGPRDGEIVGHASVQPDARGGAEIAFAVADELQGRGLGRRLVRLALDLARRRGARRASATMLADNAPMRRLLTDAGRPVTADALEAGTEEIVLDLVSA